MNNSAAPLAVCVFVAAAVPRLAVVASTAPASPNYYWTLSTSLLQGGPLGYNGTPVTSIEPLYPAFLAAARWLTGDRYLAVMSLQALVGAVGAVFMFLLTTRLSGRRGAGLAAGAAFAFYPYLVRQAAAPHELTLSATLLVAVTLQFYSVENTRHAAACGAWCGLLILLRYSYLPLAAVTAALMASRRRVRDAAALTCVSLLFVLPWAVRCWKIDGSIAPTRVGENLFVSTCRVSLATLPYHDVDLLLPYAYSLVEPEVDAALPPALFDRAIDDRLLAHALAFARVHPLETIRIKLRNLVYVFWPGLLPQDGRLNGTKAIVEGGRIRFEGLRPRPALERVAHTVSHSIITIGALAGLWLRRRQVLSTDALLMLIVALTALTHAVFFPTTRLVAPMAFVLMFYAGVAVDRLVSKPGIHVA